MVAEIKSVPIQEPITEIAPKRRGRPPKLNPDGTRANPPRSSGSGSSRRRSSLEPEITAFLTMVNSVVTMTPLGSEYDPASIMEAATTNDLSKLRVTRIGDELDAAEITLLAKGIDGQAQRSPRFRKYVENVLGAGASGGLIATVGMIAARRASRHGVLPPFIDPALGSMIAGGKLDGALAFVQPSDPKPDNTTGETEPERFDFEATIAQQ